MTREFYHAIETDAMVETLEIAQGGANRAVRCGETTGRPVDGKAGAEVGDPPEGIWQISSKSRLIELAANGKHCDVKADPLSLHRLIS